jgi:outer membrane lipoprotein
MKVCRLCPTSGGVILLTFSLVTSGCTGFIPAELQEKIQWGISLQNLQQDLKSHKGQLVVLGGEILDVKNRVDGDRVEVLQRPLDASNRPNLAGESAGRFVVKLSKEVSLEKGYGEGQPLTVVGEVTEESESRAGKDIPSPILTAKFVRLWSPADYAPRSRPTYYYSERFLYPHRIFLGPRRLRNPCS